MDNPQNESNITQESPQENIEILLMEKDKQIITLTKLSKDLNNQIDSLSKIIQAKNYEILNLQTEVSTLQSDNKISNQTISILNSKLHDLTKLNESKENQFEAAKRENAEKMENISNTFNNHIKDYEQVVLQSQNLEKENEGLKEQFLEKENQIAYYEQLLVELKRENKKILFLNKSIQEKDSLIINLTKQLDSLKDENNALLGEKNDLIKKVEYFNANKKMILSSAQVNPKIEQNFNNLEDMILNMQNNFKYQISQYELKNKQLRQDLSDKNEENSKLAEFILSQLTLAEAQIEKEQSDEYTYNNSPRLDNDDIKYSLIKNKLKSLISKILDIKLQKKSQEEKSDIMNKTLTNKNFELKQQLMEQQYLNENTHDEIKSMSQIIKDQKTQIKEINQKVENFNALNDELQNQSEGLNNLKAEVDNFFSQYFEIFNQFKEINEYVKTKYSYSYSQFNDNDFDKALDILKMLLSIITALQEDLELTNKDLKNTQEVVEILENENKKLNINSEKTRNESNYEQEILREKIEEHSKNLKDNLKNLEQISTNRDKLKIQNENLKNKVAKLEYNLEMLTKSHYDLEQEIQNNQKLKLEVTNKKTQKINQLMQQLSLKDLKIKTLENIVSKYEAKAKKSSSPNKNNISYNNFENDINLNDINLNNYNNNNDSNLLDSPKSSKYAGKIINKKQFNLIKKNFDLNKSDDDFQQSVQHEIELNNLLKKFNPDYNKDLSDNSFAESLNNEKAIMHNRNRSSALSRRDNKDN